MIVPAFVLMRRHYPMGNEFSQGLTKNASEGLLRMVLLEILGGVLQIRGTSPFIFFVFWLAPVQSRAV
jgi:hypothetical protein